MFSTKQVLPRRLIASLTLGESGEAVLTTRHVQFCRTTCTPIATLPIELFVYLVSVLLDLGMSVSCSYHVIMSSLLWVFSYYSLDRAVQLGCNIIIGKYRAIT